jgi:type II secretory pathway component PulK
LAHAAALPMNLRHQFRRRHSRTALDHACGNIANEIIEARPFKNIDDLNRVRGISPAKLAKIRPFVMIRKP